MRRRAAPRSTKYLEVKMRKQSATVSFFGATALLAALALFAAIPAAAEKSDRVVVHASEVFPPNPDPGDCDGTLTFTATGGIFGHGITGTGVSTGTCSATADPNVFRSTGSDVYTTRKGTLTLNFTALCTAICDGTWWITRGTRAYTGAEGRGTFHDVTTTLPDGTALGEDTLIGHIKRGHAGDQTAR